jgi:hypothetical protein
MADAISGHWMRRRTRGGSERVYELSKPSESVSVSRASDRNRLRGLDCTGDERIEVEGRDAGFQRMRRNRRATAEESDSWVSCPSSCPSISTG